MRQHERVTDRQAWPIRSGFQVKLMVGILEPGAARGERCGPSGPKGEPPLSLRNPKREEQRGPDWIAAFQFDATEVRTKDWTFLTSVLAQKREGACI